MPRKRKPQHTSSWWHQRWWVLLAAPLALAIAAAVAFVVQLRPPEQRAVLPCVDRVVAVDLSSMGRTPEHRVASIELIRDAAISAAICEAEISAVGVRGGGRVSTLIGTADLAGMTPTGPTTNIRGQRFAPDDEARIIERVTENLDQALARGDGVERSSLVAIISAAAERSEPGVEVVLMTHGIHVDDDVDLNRALLLGEGAELASQLQVPAVSAERLVILGIAQVDSATAVPSATWVGEIRSFNQTLCESTGVKTCRILSTATPMEALS